MSSRALVIMFCHWSTYLECRLARASVERIFNVLLQLLVPITFVLNAIGSMRRKDLPAAATLHQRQTVALEMAMLHRLL